MSDKEKEFREWKIASEEMECSVHGPSTSGEFINVVEKSALDQANEKIRERDLLNKNLANKNADLADALDQRDEKIRVLEAQLKAANSLIIARGE